MKNLKFLNLAFLTIALAITAPLDVRGADGTQSSPEAALRAALDGSAEWTMERRLAGAASALKSSGRVDCRAGESIVWKTLEPFETSVTMSTNSMIFVDEDGRREKPLDELPHYADIRKATDAFVAGDRTAFDGVFSLAETSLPGGGWRLEFKPEISAMKHLFTAIELSGAALPTNAVIHNADGGRSVIRFRESPRDR